MILYRPMKDMYNLKGSNMERANCAGLCSNVQPCITLFREEPPLFLLWEGMLRNFGHVIVEARADGNIILKKDETGIL